MHDGLVLDRVTKDFAHTRALTELSLSVGSGELFGFVGGNGAGKTTAMRIVLGVLAADSGEVTWHGYPLHLATRRRIGYMPEERGLYPTMGVREQLVYLAELHGVRRRQASANADYWLERVDLTAQGRAELSTLSLGNQQRVQLAAALVHDPVLLVLDEPFSGLDPVAIDVMCEVLREQAARGVPVVFSSHQLDLVERLCDRVGIINDGTLVAQGTVEQLRTGSTRRFLVEVAEAQTDWLAEVPGARQVGATDDAQIVELAEGLDDQELLRTAMGAGTVRSFAPYRPRLAELFRDVVDAPAASSNGSQAVEAERSTV
ncbi:ATP-binding cassette domain-containing protein [Lipingzhangella sp. LS1_29]|uniref:ATP-binding cassette domain-containing protein n=1 Tax=Lipingzhangella rawalii TaxID=2055835 RepID=A0ABU2H2B6_9ACTN|nr:ATP-binding cassette domain-containing protein [Lipingzhangella rawalii]MDS1269441.1 ATP-binding cassette domain-containing protein [Lipingzhangella rawalii]